VIAFAVDWDGGPSCVELARAMAGQGARVASSAATPGASAACAAVGRAGEVAALEELGLLAALDGRLHDVDDLRAQLACARDATPAVVLLRAYERWGDEILARLRGEHAFVVWDGRAGRVLAARDHLGVRPLAYATRGRTLAFSSDVGALVRAGVVAPVPDDQMVVELLTRRFVSTRRSFLRDAKLVPAGHAVVADPGGLAVREHRRPPTTELRFADTASCLDAVRAALETAVRRSLAGDDRFVIELSGGVDSTSIACLADGLVARDPRLAGRVSAAAGLYEGLPCDETEYVRQVERALHFPVATWNASAVDVAELSSPDLAGPGAAAIMAGGSRGSFEIARARGARVFVNGTGGDQVGPPLGVPLDQLRTGRWRDLARDFVTAEPGRRAPFLRWALGYVAPQGLRDLRRALRPRDDAPTWLSPSAAALARTVAAERFEAHDAWSRRRAEFVSVGQHLRWRNACDPQLERSLDAKQRAVGAAGLEMRFPFLDWDLFSLLLAVPVEHWPKAGGNARIHREALRGVLPERIYRRRTKAEMTPAVVNRVRAQTPVFEAMLEGGPWRSEPYVPRSAARGLFASFRKGEATNLTEAYALGALIELEAWLRSLLGYSAAASRGREESHVDVG
jgi:asparagine synthase (glutamine-hydrolysing)